MKTKGIGDQEELLVDVGFFFIIFDITAVFKVRPSKPHRMGHRDIKRFLSESPSTGIPMNFQMGGTSRPPHYTGSVLGL